MGLDFFLRQTEGSDFCLIIQSSRLLTTNRACFPRELTLQIIFLKYPLTAVTLARRCGSTPLLLPVRHDLYPDHLCRTREDKKVCDQYRALSGSSVVL